MGKSLTIEAMQELAHAKNGACLSSRYVNAVTKLRWRCAKGHEWEAQPSMVKNDGTWCPFCSGKLKHIIEVMKELAKQHGGECLADHYVNAFAKLRWRCAKGHEWEACGSAIKNHKTWCPICAYDVVSSKTSLGLDEMREIARSRGGECLSEVYPRRHGGKLLWRCRDGHEWEAPPAQVKHAKQWCPICASGYSERLCRAMFEAIFDERFPKVRPLWLQNSRGNHMELDGYCKKLGVAFEYHGIQHYEEKVFFHRKSSLSLRQQDDNAKRSLCKEHGVSLIEIPYSIKSDELQAYIYSQCNKLNIWVVKKPPINLADLDYYSRNRIDEMRSFAAAKGGECLVDRYVTVITPVTWRCQKGHEWKSAFCYIKKGSWCPACYGNIKLKIEDMQALAKKKGGECLSTSYRDILGKLTWRCAKGHEWSATANDVKNSGSWCPVCAGVKKHDLKTMMDIARNRGGECLSNTYVNSKTKLQWRCAKGHEWVAAPATILSSRGTWCPYCAKKAKLTIQEMGQIAIARGGKCLSDNYINGSTKLRWQCRSGHEWLATPDNVKNGESWCPICAKRTKLS